MTRAPIQVGDAGGGRLDRGTHARGPGPRPRVGGGAWVGAMLLGLVAGGGPESSAVAPREAEWFRPGSVASIRIELAAADRDRLRSRPREYVPARVEVNGETWDEVAVHLKGSIGSFRPFDDRPGLTLDFGRYRSGRSCFGSRKLHLNNAVEDPGWLSAALGADAFRRAGVPAARVAHARVELDRRPLGVYVLVEGFAPGFFRDELGSDDGELYESKGGGDVEAPMKRQRPPGAEGHPAWIPGLGSVMAEPDATRRWQRWPEVLDRDRFLSFLAVEVVLGHRDGYAMARNNFRIYRDAGTGRAVFLPHGLDQLLDVPDLPWNPAMSGAVARSVLESPEAREAYRERLVRWAGVLLDSGFLESRLAAWEQSLGRSLGQGVEARAVARAAETWRERLRARQDALRQQLAEPVERVPVFSEGSASLGGWIPIGAGASAEAHPPGGIERDDRSVLVLDAGRAPGVSWRTRVRLDPGRYRFEGASRVRSVEPLPFGRARGAGLRVAGRTRSEEGGLIGETPWTLVSTEFEVTGARQDVEMICELRARSGEAWFDLATLKLTRLADPTASIP